MEELVRETLKTQGDLHETSQSIPVEKNAPIDLTQTSVK